MENIVHDDIIIRVVHDAAVFITIGNSGIGDGIPVAILFQYNSMLWSVTGSIAGNRASIDYIPLRN
jgi:hypothetical protein